MKFYRIDPNKLKNFLSKIARIRSTCVDIQTQTTENSISSSQSSTSIENRFQMKIRSNLREIFTDFSSTDDENEQI